MTTGSIFPHRLTRVDGLMRPDHWYLADSDECYFIGEYAARRGYTHSATNSLILNFKKPLYRRRRPDWRHKARAIRIAAAAFRGALHPEALDRLTFVPVPPSRARSDPFFDDRLTRMLAAVRSEPTLDARELVVQTASAGAAHAKGFRPVPEAIEELYRIDETLTEPVPRAIAVVDDLLTTGAHFRATRSILRGRFPIVPVVGLFIARRVPTSSEPEDRGDIED